MALWERLIPRSFCTHWQSTKSFWYIQNISIQFTVYILHKFHLMGLFSSYRSSMTLCRLCLSSRIEGILICELVQQLRNDKCWWYFIEGHYMIPGKPWNDSSAAFCSFWWNLKWNKVRPASWALWNQLLCY